MCNQPGVSYRQRQGGYSYSVQWNKGIIEVKSFVDMSETRKGTEQAAAYARSLNLNSVTLALFVPVDDETVLAKLSGEHQSNGVTVTVVAIGWT